MATGVAVEQILKPMEDSIRLRRERKMAENARLAGRGGGDEEADARVDVVQGVGQR